MRKNFWKNKRVIITGGAGFIGSHFVEELLSMGALITCVDIKCERRFFKTFCSNLGNLRLVSTSLLDLKKVERTFKNHDIIINCAALDGNMEFKIKNAARILDENNTIVSNVLNAARKNDIGNVVLLSSAEVYPTNLTGEIDEENDYKKNFDNVQNGYVLSKRYAELLGELYSRQYSINIFLPRPTNVYGPRDKFDTRSNRVIPSLIHKIIHSEEVEIWGDGLQVRGFIYVKDLVHFILEMVEVGKYNTMNMATSESISIIDLAKLISSLLNEKVKIKLLLDKPAGAKVRVLDNRRLQSISEIYPRSLKDGLKEVIDWYKTNVL